MEEKQIVEFNKILQNFEINAECMHHEIIDNYLFYDLKLKSQTKIKDIEKYLDEIALALKIPSKPNVKVFHKEGLIRLEFVLPRNERLNLFEIFTDDVPEGDLICLLGKSLNGENIWMDLAQNPHMIVSGTTGSGKSTLLHNIIANMLNYNDVKLYLIDPKNIEFSEYEKKIKNINVSYTFDESLFTIESLLELMEERYSLLRSGSSIKKFPHVLLIIDEFADLIIQDDGNQFYKKLCALAQKCRAARIHIILSTQRPSVSVINGAIKANFPSRISCRVSSHIDSKIILDSVGAENLMGKGDALIKDSSRSLERFQIAWTDANQVCSNFGTWYKFLYVS